MSRRQPEDMVHNKALLPFGNFWKCRRRLSFSPGLAEVGGSKDGRSQVARARGREQRASVAWVQHEMMDDVPEEHWLRQFPGSAGSIAPHDKCSFAGADEQDD